jgi:polysaccharide biosynthesis/export protein
MRIRNNRFIHFLLPLVLFFSTTGLYAEIISKDYIIGPGDILEIQIWEHDDLQRKVEVSQEGAFTFPLIDTVQAAGLSVFQLEETMKARLGDGYLVAPQVSITVSGYHSRKVFLFGAVRKPGAYAIRQKMPLFELIAEAGGLTDKAGHIVKIVRGSDQNKLKAVSLEEASQEEIITLDLRRLSGEGAINAYIYDRDSIYVLDAPRIYVTGEVKSPGDFPWESDLTVREAVSLAGGATKRGAVGRTSIIRLEDGKEREFRPSMSDTLLPSDIIKVPESYF